MADYAIGDIQGCAESFNALLQEIRFKPDADRLFLAGDLVARGPDSLGVLRQVKAMGDNVRVVLGNHDLHLLAGWYGFSPVKKKDRTGPVIAAPDGRELMDWLRAQPLFLDIPEHHAVLTHAGIPPCWSLSQTRVLAAEVSAVLRHDDLVKQFLGGMYGNSPNLWHEQLTGTRRWRLITNYLTRMRLVSLSGELEFSFKEDLGSDLPDGYHPWFSLPNPSLKGVRVLFGHWAALEGSGPQHPIIALDGGCVWGGKLLAYRLDDGEFFSTATGCVNCWEG
jgi:bis(5'-nucleosyl)-tetraphosphatase (symmetrical)